MKNLSYIFLVLIVSGCTVSPPVKDAVIIPLVSNPVEIPKKSAIYTFKYMYGKESAARSSSFMADFTCDGVNDVVVFYNHLDHPQGPRFELMLITGHDGKLKKANQWVQYVKQEPKPSKFKKAYFIESGEREPDVAITELPKSEMEIISSSKNSCNKFVEVKGSTGVSYVFVFDVVLDYFTKKERFGIREGVKTKSYEFYMTHNI